MDIKRELNKYAICLNAKKCSNTGHVKHIQNFERPKGSENVELDVALCVKDNPHNNSHQTAADTGISQLSVLWVLKEEKYIIQ